MEKPQTWKSPEKKNESCIYDSNNVKVERGDMHFNQNILYFYFYKQQIARIKLDDKKGIKEIFAGTDDNNHELISYAITSCHDLPYREQLINFFNIDTNSLITEEFEHKYNQEAERIRNIREEYTQIEKMPGWQTSDPKNHDESNFRYIVHTISPHSSIHQLLKASILQVEYNEDDSNVNIDPLEQPEKFVERKFISTSVIDQAHYGLYGNYGVILNVPEDNVLKADSQTMATVHFDNAGFKPNYKSASEILKQTRFGDYNEVVIAGVNQKTRDKIEFAGGIIVQDSIAGEDLDVEGADKIRKFCDSYNLPLVYLKKPLKV